MDICRQAFMSARSFLVLLEYPMRRLMFVKTIAYCKENSMRRRTHVIYVGSHDIMKMGLTVKEGKGVECQRKFSNIFQRLQQLYMSEEFSITI
jgi:hypothetical protein